MFQKWLAFSKNNTHTKQTIAAAENHVQALYS